MSQVQQVKEATDIVQIIGERIQLNRSGSSLRGLCPFHSEKSPSFFVSEQFQRYKCFGCGETGDVFTFLEKYEGMTFSEALKFLADRAGIKLDSYKPSPEDDRHQRLLSVLHFAKEYYHFLLTKHEAGEPGRKYLRERGVTAESIRLFQLGYSLPAWDGLLAYLHKKKKFTLDDIRASGLTVSSKQGREYDRFRQRLMFPLTNHRGQVVGFSGRLMDASAKEAKYINSPETELYHKSEMLFGFSELYQEIRKQKEVVVVEGEFDVISSAQAHVNNVVAIKGSALTTQHIQLISRAAQRVLFSLDMDNAGVNATKRAISLAKDTLDMRVIVIPSGKDPDELARTNPKEWRDAVKASLTVYEYLIQAALRQHAAQTAEGKRAIIDELAPVLGGMSHAVEQDVYIKRLAAALEVREDLVRQDIERFKQGRPRGGMAPKKTPDSPTPVVTLDRRSKLERYLLFLLFQTDDDRVQLKVQQLKPLHFQYQGLQPLVNHLLQAKAPIDIRAATQQLPADLQELVFELSADPEFVQTLDTHQDKADDEWQKTLTDVFQEQVRGEISHINQELAQLDQQTALTPENEARQAELLGQIVTLRNQLSSRSNTP